MRDTSKIKLIVAAMLIALIVFLAKNLFHKVDDTEWQAVQALSGTVEIKENAGFYLAFFPKVTEYPRNTGFEFRKPRAGEDVEDHPDESMKVTFNDGGTADIGCTLRISTPATAQQKREFHRQFAGSQVAIKQAVSAHLLNVIKASGPIMSASENQASRKSEFNAVIQDQLNDGLYDMRRVQVKSDQVDEKGQPILVWATEVQRDANGNPKINSPSPLALYGITVSQFSIGATDYDEQTLEQFSTKKQAYLRAESAKAERDGETQQRFMIEEKGKRQLAETTAAANLEKEKATIEAEKEKEVAETKASQILAVAKLEKETAETKATQLLEVAKLSKQAAEEKAKEVVGLAQAEKEKIALGGAISEKDLKTLETQKETAIGVATALSKVNVPQVVIAGGNGTPGSSGGNTQDNLINLMLLKSNGLLDAMKVPTLAPAH